MSDLVQIAIYVNRFEAEMAKSALEGAGIDVLLRSDDCGGMRPHLWMQGVELLVRSEDRERAAELLATTAIVEEED